MRAFTIKCEWDADAKVWYVAESDVPGLAAEAPTVEKMQEILLARIPELIQLNLPELFRPLAEVPFELLYSQRSTARLPC